MTAKEKAKQLVDKFDKEAHFPVACAIIAVDEIIQSYEINKHYSSALIPVYNFWKSVKSELEAL